MDVNELISMLSEGLSPDQAASVKAAIERDTVKTKVSGLKAQTEYQTLLDKQAQLQAELDGGPDKPGAKQYQKWYDDNFAKVQQLEKDFKAYQTKFGALDSANPNPQNPNPQSGITFKTQADLDDAVARAASGLIQTQYAPMWSKNLVVSSRIVQRHMLAGRKNEVDFDTLGKLATEKFGGDLESAYADWDRPEREKIAKAETDKEITRRVDEELQKRGASAHFPGAADLSPTALSARSQKDIDGFDKTALMNDLAKEWNSAGVTS
jgi:hypothetical protein